MEPFLAPLVYQKPLCYMKPEVIEELRAVGLILECTKCRNVNLKQEPFRASQCGCGHVTDHRDEWWAVGEYVPPPSGVIPTVPSILAKLTRAMGIKVEALADQLGVARTTLYYNLAGRSIPKRETLRMLADICAERGLTDEATALRNYWAVIKTRKPRGRFFTPEAYGMTPGFWEAKADQAAAERSGIVPRPEFRRPTGT